MLITPDSKWGFSLQKEHPDKINSLAAVRLDDANFDGDLQIEGDAPAAEVSIAQQCK